MYEDVGERISRRNSYWWYFSVYTIIRIQYGEILCLIF